MRYTALPLLLVVAMGCGDGGTSPDPQDTQAMKYVWPAWAFWPGLEFELTFWATEGHVDSVTSIAWQFDNWDCAGQFTVDGTHLWTQESSAIVFDQAPFFEVLWATQGMALEIAGRFEDNSFRVTEAAGTWSVSKSGEGTCHSTWTAPGRQ